MALGLERWKTGFPHDSHATSTGVHLKVVLAHGKFDLLHYGHILFLRRARLLGDYLIVTVTADRFMKRKCLFPAKRRIDFLKELRCVSAVGIVEEETGVSAILKYKPTIYAKGADATPVIREEVKACEEVGAHVAYVKSPIYYHSSRLAGLDRKGQKG